MTTSKPVVLCILDGWGKRADQTGNAPALAETPHFDQIMAHNPVAELITHGPDVGLPEGQMGNSEVGHMNIGAGRVVWMDLPKIDNAIADGSFSRTPAFERFRAKLIETRGAAHLMGLVSTGGVHAHLGHMRHAAEVLAAAGIPVWLHLLTDGRDVAPKSALDYIETLLKDLPSGIRVASVCGRYYAMDRDNRWERVAKAAHAIGAGSAPRAERAKAIIRAAYEVGETDEFITPAVIEGYTGIAPEDGLFCVNFRSDRAREILTALLDSTADVLPEPLDISVSAALGMVSYSKAHDALLDVMFPKEEIVNTLAAWVAQRGLTQFHLAETEKYPHVTFFLNGGKETPEDKEDRYMAASPKVATYDLQPEMSSGEVTEHFVGAIEAGYDLIVTNYANPDMVGHTGDLEAAIKACEAVDRGLGKVLAAVQAAGGAMIVTADHGNCETMIDPDTGGPHTAHTLNPVPIALVGGPAGCSLSNGRLADIAPTLLALMGVPQPAEMTGKSLIRP
jgi:2,3-bisphosphoglycerate-independent phosphoglycerate mutase